jgi:hypothetical protein
MQRSTPPRTRWRQRRWASSAFASPTVRPRAQVRTEEALVPKRPEMENRLRRTHQRRQTPARAQSLPLQRPRRNAALGRPRYHRRQPRQYRPRDAQGRQRVAVPFINRRSTSRPPLQGGLLFVRPFGPLTPSAKLSILRRKVASSTGDAIMSDDDRRSGFGGRSGEDRRSGMDTRSEEE